MLFPSVSILLEHQYLKEKSVTPIKIVRASSYIKGRISGEF